MSKESNKKAGVVYILTNPSFPEYVKIGYADDINKRLALIYKAGKNMDMRFPTVNKRRDKEIWL